MLNKKIQNRLVFGLVFFGIIGVGLACAVFKGLKEFLITGIATAFTMLGLLSFLVIEVKKTMDEVSKRPPTTNQSPHLGNKENVATNFRQESDEQNKPNEPWSKN